MQPITILISSLIFFHIFAMTITLSIYGSSNKAVLFIISILIMSTIMSSMSLAVINYIISIKYEKIKYD